MWGLNPGPWDYESHALPTELAGHWELYFEEGKYDIRVN